MKTTHTPTTQDIAQLSALLDGELSSANATKLRQRMQTEATLQAAYTELALTQEAMRTLPTLKPPRSLRIDSQRLHQARGWRWWLISPPGGQLLPTLGVAMSLCLCLLFGAVAMQPAESHTLKGAVSTPDGTNGGTAAQSDLVPESVLIAPDQSAPAAGTNDEPARQSAPVAESALIAPNALPFAGSPWAWLGVVAGVGVLGGTVRWSWHIRGRKRATKR